MFSCKFAAYFQNNFSWEHVWRDASGFFKNSLPYQVFQKDLSWSFFFSFIKNKKARSLMLKAGFQHTDFSASV